VKEDAFAHSSCKKGEETPFRMEDEDGDMVGDDVLINLPCEI